jgi:hypothetical protein
MKENDKDKFTFANDIESDIEEPSQEMQSEELSESEQSKFERVSKLEYAKRLNIIRTIIVLFVASAAVFVFALIWQKDTSILAICNALWLLLILNFFVGWIILMNNMRIFTPLVYAVKSFGRMLIGRRMDEDYYTYVKAKEKNPVPSYYYKIFFIASIIFAIPAVVLLLIII